MFEEIATLAIFHFMLLFCRVGAALMVITGFGETYVLIRYRLMLSFVISLVLLPVLEPLLPKEIPLGILEISIIIMGELLIGLIIGTAARMLQAILHMAGMFIAFQSSLASALLFDASQGSQGSVFGNLMTILGLTLIFMTDLHHMMLMGIAQSYITFSVGVMAPISDFAELATNILNDGMRIAVMLASPLIVTSLLLYLGAGLLGRLMPNMQVFFVLIPIQIYISLTIFVITLSAMMMWYLQHFETTMRVFYAE